MLILKIKFNIILLMYPNRMNAFSKEKVILLRLIFHLCKDFETNH